MNIFYLDSDPKRAAELQINKHVVKMILESAQLLCTAHRMLDGEHYIDASSGRRLQRWRMQNNVLEEALYKATHFNHPSAKWVRESIFNYLWLYKHFFSLCREYEKRYNKKHLTCIKLEEILSRPPENIPPVDFTTPPLAMPDEYKRTNAVKSYRIYYESEKLALGTKEDFERYFNIINKMPLIEDWFDFK